jgi:thiol-disulfide isomerase/thioredoxin
MKYFFSILFLFVINLVKAEGMEFHHGTWDEALAKSKASGKLIFMDAFTTWCGPCKRMSAQTFPLQEVGDFYNANFINVKMDMEKGEGLMLAGKYGVDSYPTLLYIDGEGKLVSKAIGYMDGPKFIDAGKSALRKNDKTELYAKEYAAGKRDFNTVYNYVRALNYSGKSSTKIANEYINSQKDMTTNENLSFLLEAAAEVDSRIFDLFIKNKDKLIAQYGADVIQSKIVSAATKTVKKAVEFQTIDLVTTAISKIKSLVPTQADRFQFQSNLMFYSSVIDAEAFLQTIKNLPGQIEKDPKQMLDLANTIEKSYSSEAKLLAAIEKLLNQSMSATSTIDQKFALARIYVLNNKTDKAYKLLDESISDGKNQNKDVTLIEQFKLKLGKS